VGVQVEETEMANLPISTPGGRNFQSLLNFVPRLRGEPEATINLFVSMKHLGQVIDGATFRRLYESSKRPPTNRGAGA
jgi:hypothetical protein